MINFIVQSIFLLTAGLILSLPAHSLQAHPYPQWAPLPPAPPGLVSFCPYGYSSFCQTYSGQICPFFAANPQPSWFSACLTEGPFYFCLNLPNFPQPFAQNTCHLRGSPCTCSFGLNNGYYIYEPGYVI